MRTAPSQIILFQDPYPFFKGVFANFSAISLADNSAGFAHVNGGVWYVQDAAHGGPVQRMFREFERRTLSLLDGSRPCAPTSNLQIARQLTCLAGRALGRPSQVRCCRWRFTQAAQLRDNQSFQLSFKKGWSRAKRLTAILRDLHSLSVRYDCVFVPKWISTHDNIGADALSRQDFVRFRAWAQDCIPSTLERAN